MTYQNKLMPFEGKRMHPVLQHYEWLAYSQKEALDFSALSEPRVKKPLGLTPSELSQLREANTDSWRDRLANLELIFFGLEDHLTEKSITDKNIQTLNESYEATIKNRRASRRNRSNFEKEAISRQQAC